MKSFYRILIAFALVFLSLNLVSAQKKTDVFAKMEKEHAEFLKTWLKTKSNLRLATEADCKNKAGLKLQREGEDANYQPYYLAYDLSGDKQTDFAVALIDKKKRVGSNFVLVIFNRAKTDYQQAHYLANLDLRQSGLFFSGDEPKRLVVGEFQTDNCSYFKWTGKKYAAEDCGAGEN